MSSVEPSVTNDCWDNAVVALFSEDEVGVASVGLVAVDDGVEDDVAIVAEGVDVVWVVSCAFVVELDVPPSVAVPSLPSSTWPPCVWLSHGSTAFGTCEGMLPSLPIDIGAKSEFTGVGAEGFEVPSAHTVDLASDQPVIDENGVVVIEGLVSQICATSAKLIDCCSVGRP